MEEYYRTNYSLKCNQKMSFLASPQFLENACHIGSICMIIISSYALFLMIKKSPPAMKSSVFYMVHLHIWTMFCDFTFAVMLLPFFMLPTIAGTGLGLMMWLGVPSKLQIWIVFGALGGMCCTILSLFEQRHRSIVTDSKFVIRRKSTRIIWNTILYGYHVNFGVPEVLTMPDDAEQEEVKLKLLAILPCPPPLFFHPDTFVIQRDGTLFNPHMYFTCFSMSCVAAYFSLHTMWFLLPANNPSMSPATRKLQRNFFFAMCVQISIPVFVILTPNIYWNLTITFEFHSQEANNLSIFFFTLHGISASFAIIFLYAPYRKYTFELVRTKVLRLPVYKTSVFVSTTGEASGRRLASTNS